MIYIGIDPSFTRTCCCVFNNNIHYSTYTIEFNTKKKNYIFKHHIIGGQTFYLDKNKLFKDDLDRLPILYNKIDEIVYDLSKPFPCEDIAIAIEEPMGLHLGAGAKIDRVFTALYLACHHKLGDYKDGGSTGDIIELRIYKPSQIKKFLTGKGNAKKEIMIKEAYKKFGFEAENNDEVDAYAIGRYLISDSITAS